ncbi:plantaricin C family lantibiotic [Staphylospora marina]|uniref:plantaricin C family lantibiotic n=1 Tax=Staphylospora marina TaxID=2490858 RepID=UPI0019D1BEB7|nr:plantaricin C family lantibiotic [Staphylospora marina]
MSREIRMWKDPVFRLQSEGSMMEHPSGNVMEELREQDLLSVAGGCDWWNISCHLGNTGRFCTLTKECQPNCNY